MTGHIVATLASLTIALWALAAGALGVSLVVIVLPPVALICCALVCRGTALHRNLGKVPWYGYAGLGVIALGAHQTGHLFLREIPDGPLAWFVVLLGLVPAAGIGVLAHHLEVERRATASREKRLRSLVRSVDDVVFILDRDGRHQEIYGNWRDDEFFAREEYLGKTAPEVIGEQEGKRHLEYHRRAIEEGPQRFEWEFLDRSGRRCVEIKLTPLHDERGDVNGTVGVSRDITHLKQTQEHLERQMAENRELLQEVHHRSKNNMQLMSSLLLLQAQSASAETRRTLMENAHRIQAMARVHEHLYGQTNATAVAMDELVHESVHQLAQLYGSAGQEVATRIQADRMLLPLDTALPAAQILQELASNAFAHAFGPDYVGPEPRVSIGLTNHSEGVVTLSVSDNGRGMPESPQERDEEGANGSMGLAFVDLLARQLRGDVTVSCGTDPAPRGQAACCGTTVTVRFPPPRPRIGITPRPSLDVHDSLAYSHARSRIDRLDTGRLPR